MSDLLEAASAALGVPAPLISRAAAARATETGASVDEVLSAWAGGETVPAGAPAAAPAEAPDAEPEAAAPEETPAPAPAAASPAMAPPQAAPAAVAATPAPAPAEVTPREAAHLPEVITVPTAGIRERTSTSIPRWLTALMVVVPFVALFALGGGATGNCGSSTELTVDVVTGNVVDCDGSEFAGRQTGGGGGADFIAMGERIYAGAEVPGVTCAGCHGAQGQGGAGPALSGVMTTFSACTDHLEWVALGSMGFQSAGRTTYGDTDKPINGGMPGFAASLSEEQIAAVSAFERVRFDGADRDATLVDCGLAEPEGGEEGEEGEEDGEDAGEGATEDAEARLFRPSS